MSLDVITLVSETTPPQYVNQCRRSVRVAAELCTYPINYIESPGVPGHIGRAMGRAIAKSKADYVAFVDDDDFLLPNAFLCLRQHFDAHPAAICAREIRLYANGSLVPHDGRHHLSAWRRDVLDSVPLVDYPSRPYLPLYKSVTEASVADELSWVYVYRVRMSAALRLRTKRGGV